MLFRRVQEGCWEAFDVLFHTYAEQLFFYAMGFVNYREEARDIVQGTFITLWEQRGKIQCTGAIYPYLLRLVKNACLNYQVHEKVKERYLLEKRMTEEEGEEIRSSKVALLRHGALGAAMSGSGPTVIGQFDDRQKAVRAKEALEGRYRQTYLAAPVKILE